MAVMSRRPLIAGNWKMNGLQSSLAELRKVISASAGVAARAELLVCPPATLLVAFAAAARGSNVAVGGQDCHGEAAGAFTGDISAEMLADAGATAVIVGHSERRAMHSEIDAQVCAKARAAWRAGLTAIVCIGETRGEREAKRALDIVGGQLDGSLPDAATAGNLIVAYEPVWAIGTGVTASIEQAQQAHAFLRGLLKSRFDDAVAAATRILYGGSVKADNALELLSQPDVDGALVGGASLKSDSFIAIIEAGIQAMSRKL